ncbi:longitudinals lacking protein, isoforms H/M/V-like isoform X2 [Macrosteles quadrilineatus]|uniref:longitudinals lacking protein, isoforms H/M/V-like isoform X2 n=1 Tax=Macrosteles quadrilineatus TaxID=74068 RepID=UPI0023E2C4A0|nr:longitudinals lacking protein, isoforms H/M/V-like isoform X2 [Macrosteles quadrilineatus]
MGSQQLYSLSWGEFGTSLTSTVQILRGHGEMVDVTLAAGGRIFPAHKLVLSAASPLLMELLKSTHCHHPVVMLAGITAPDLEALLQFVYQGEVSVDPSQLPSLLQAAHCLDIQALSPQTLTTEKTMAQISVPVVMGDTSMAPMSRETSMTSPLLPHRKRKRRQNRASETERESHWTNVSVGNVAVESQTMEGSAIQDSGDDSMKDEIIDEQHCNGEPDPPPLGGKSRCASEQPRTCPLCGLLIRQARNLRRHLLTACTSRPTPDHIDYLECQMSTPQQTEPRYPEVQASPATQVTQSENYTEQFGQRENSEDGQVLEYSELQNVKP